MSDVTAAPEQAEIADSLVAEEPQEQVAEATEAEQQVEPEVSEQPLEQQQQETESQEEVENWLPTDQDKIFPDEVYARYAQRYNLTPEQAQEPTLRQLLHDKINSDIFIQQQQQLEAEQPEPEPEAEPTREAPLSREQYFQNLDRVIAERTDPQVATQFHAEFLKAFGVPDAEIAKTSPQQAMAFTHTASKYMLNLMNTFAPDLFAAQLQQQVNQAYPGFGDMYERSSMAMAWDKVRNSDPSLGNLPAYGTKDFTKTLREAAAKIPGFDEMQFTDAQGKALPAMQNAERKYAMLAKIASGQNVNPQLLQQAAAAGARNARRADVRRSAGNLGSGQSKGASQSSGSSKFQSNTDLFDDETMDLYKREHGRL